MKTKLLLTTLLSFAFYLLSSQIPQGLNYQALAGDVSGNPIRNTNLQVRISILSDTLLPVTVWEELHSTIRTNVHGIFQLVIGSGVRQTASSVAAFRDINWGAAPLYIRTQIYYQNAWKNMGSAKIWTVPYAMVAGKLTGTINKLGVTGITTSPDSALFEVKNKNGQTVFAVYNEGVRVYVDDGAKGAKGGFAIGGFGTAKAPSQQLFVVNTDSIRAYIDPKPVKGAKGGFAIGGFDMTKIPGVEYLRVTHDSVRIYVDETVAKGAKGGFAIGGFNQAKGTQSEFMFLTPENYFVGHKSGQNVTTAQYTSTLGYESGKNLTSGWNNIFIGFQTGYTNTSGGSNVFVGNKAGFTNLDGSNNVFVGNRAGNTNSSGSSNVFLGNAAGNSNTTGNYNILLGRSAGYDNTTGWGNIVLGDFAGSTNIDGYQNVIIGDLAGISNTEGYQNVFIGSDAGYENTTGYDNVFIGSSTGNSNTTGYYNSFLGFEAGYENTEGNYNTFLGYQAGYNSGLSSYSTSIGYKAGYALGSWQAGTYVGYEAGVKSTGRQNVFVGSDAGQAFTTGADNVIIGAGAGSSDDTPVVVSSTGSRNAFIGYYTGYKSGSGTDNVMVGAQDHSGLLHPTGSYNVYLGVDAGNLSNTGSRNVFIGYQAGKNETTSDKLYIDNSSGSSINALVYGDFLNDQLRFNAYVGIGAAPNFTYRLNIAGSAYATGNWFIPSDIRLKENVVSLDTYGVIDKVKNVGVIRYNYNNEMTKGAPASDTKYLGVIAQDLEASFPEAVATDEEGYKAVSINALAAILLQAVKDQQKQIDALKIEIEALKTR